jgi:hypothetical protein
MLSGNSFIDPALLASNGGMSLAKTTSCAVQMHHMLHIRQSMQ